MNKIGKAILNYLIKGLLIVVPIAVSIFIVVWAVTTVDSWLNVNNILGVNPQTGESRNIPGLGLLTVLTIILLAGIFVTNLVTEPMYNWFQRMMQRLPLLNFIYSSIKDLTEAFVGDEKKFNHPVLVEVEGGLKKIGFLTQNDLHKLNLPDDVAVYFPLSYSFAGQLCIVKREKVKDLDMSAADAMKLVVSGGVSGL
ncbi:MULTISPECIES: DUF502 domain-containing protein [unclassified Pedobacter]|uniref:DUF502 domain-containing protein n=1 Tax=Pedobacter TaxID=84567 RepID=UPI000B4A97F1|nr:MULTISPECIES: DUF502 domain-containing protein [unclassified Pedobacter]MCX2430835.1 DUF502 domain-containing protein [Pedobacter sp. GR22-10]MCX2583961.1 DUF502 domain-containing protein [Pedobacter sp. MR22-3]OWK69259.1 hypothetical protein CBW18_18405 [Pedobacter sp. AJM]